MSSRQPLRASLVAVLLVLLVAGAAQAASELRDGGAHPDEADETNKTFHEFGYVVTEVSNDGGSDRLSVVLPEGVTADDLSSFSGNVTDADTRESVSISSSPSIVDGPDGDGVHETVAIGVQPEGERSTRDLVVNVTGYVTWPDVGSTSDLPVQAAVEDSGRADVGPAEFARVTVRDGGDPDPSVSTLDPGEVGSSEATLRGEVDATDGADEVEVSFAYWQEGERSSTRTTTDGQTLTGAGTFSAAVSGLEAGTTYVVRAHAEESPDPGAPVTFATASSDGGDGTGGGEDGADGGADGDQTPLSPALAVGALAGAAAARRR